MNVFVRFNYIEDKDVPHKGEMQITQVEVEELTKELVLDAVAKKLSHLYTRDEINILEYDEIKF